MAKNQQQFAIKLLKTNSMSGNHSAVAQKIE
jgi:hypothetical protein